MVTRRKAPADTSTRKLVAITWRTPDGPWRTETLQITAFLITPAGALTLFLNKTPLRSFSSGAWWDLTLIGEEENPHAQTEQ